MPLPDGGKTPWPPKEAQRAYAQYETLSAWYSGSPEALQALYQGGAGAGGLGAQAFFGSESGRVGAIGRARDAVHRWFWGSSPASPAERRSKLHVPIASDIATMSADLLFSEPPRFRVEDDGTQERLDLILDEMCIDSVLLEGAEVQAALGGVYLCVTWDDQFADHPFLRVVHADAAVPEFRWGALSAVTFWRVVADEGGKVWRHLERHEAGEILHALYLGKRDELGWPVPLDSSPATALLPPVVMGIPGMLTAAYVPNMRPNRADRGSALGRSDYSDGVLTLMDALDETYCADEETEILTDHGWMNYRDLRAGDIALTLNHDTGMSEWQPVREVNVFPAQQRTMVSIESRSHSSLTTQAHRWPVERPHFRHGGGAVNPKAVAGTDRTWATSDSFRLDDRVPIAADCADLPSEAKYSDALVEAVAWFWTEGHIRKLRDGRLGRNVMITQSEVVNSEHCARIRSALTLLFGPAVQDTPRFGKAPTDGVPRWRESRRGANAVFQLSADAGDVLLEHAPDRVPTFGFLLSLTRAQLALFIEASMLADNSGKYSLAQKNPRASEAFQFACILAGYSTSIKPGMYRGEPRGYSMTNVRMRSQRHIWPGRPSVRSEVEYAGEVWCPRTENGTWLARRRGTVYFTGNSSWMRDLRLGKGRIVVPHEMLRSNGPGQGATFDPDREVYEGLTMLQKPGDPAPLTVSQFDIRVTEHAATAQNLLEQILRGSGYSVQSFGGTGDVAVTATEVHARQRMSFMTRDKKARYWRAELSRIVEVLLAVDAKYFGSAVVPERPEVEFGDSVQEQPETIARTAQLLRQAEAASTETLVRLVHGDEWEDKRVDREVAQILAEKQVAVPDPFGPPVDNVPADAVPADQQPADVPPTVNAETATGSA